MNFQLSSTGKGNEISLDQAIRNESLRYDFLTQLLPKDIPYCDSIVYDADGIERTRFCADLLVRLGPLPRERANEIVWNVHRTQKTEFTAGLFLISYFLGIGIPVPLFVGRGMFSDEYESNEISHALIAHEGTHLRQVAVGFPYFNTEDFKDAWIREEIDPRVVKSIAELDANYHSLLKIQSGEFQVRDTYRKTIVHRYRVGIVNLHNAQEPKNSRSAKEKKFIQEVLDAVLHTYK